MRKFQKGESVIPYSFSTEQLGKNIYLYFFPVCLSSVKTSGIYFLFTDRKLIYFNMFHTIKCNVHYVILHNVGLKCTCKTRGVCNQVC